MSSIIVLDGFDPPKACKSCPFLDKDLACCEILSAASNKVTRINIYSSLTDKKCPFYYLEDGHGRLLDEKDIRVYFESMRYGDEDINFSMEDIHRGLTSVLEVSPGYLNAIDRMKRNFNTCGEAVKALLMSPADIEAAIESAGELKEELDG